MRIYLAAAYGRHAEVEGHARRLRAAGFRVVSTWHEAQQEGARLDNGKDCPPCAVAGRWANECLKDLQRAELLLSFTEGRPGRGGRHVEYGFALALFKDLWVCGPEEHIFHCLPEVRQFRSFDAALQALQER